MTMVIGGRPLGEVATQLDVAAQAFERAIKIRDEQLAPLFKDLFEKVGTSHLTGPIDGPSTEWYVATLSNPSLVQNGAAKEAFDNTLRGVRELDTTLAKGVKGLPRAVSGTEYAMTTADKVHGFTELLGRFGKGETSEIAITRKLQSEGTSEGARWGEYPTMTEALSTPEGFNNHRLDISARELRNAAQDVRDAIKPS